MRVADLMSTKLQTVAPLTPVKDVLAIFRTTPIRHLLVVDEHRLLGVISDRDALGRALGPMSWLTDAEQDQALTEMGAREIMSDEITTVRPDLPLPAAAAIMRDGKLGCLPVVDDDRLVGILTEGDFVALAARG